jgi:hypothetical protein
MSHSKRRINKIWDSIYLETELKKGYRAKIRSLKMDTIDISIISI